MPLDALAYPALFLSAFGAATLLPLQSEAVLAGLLLNDAHPAWAQKTRGVTQVSRRVRRRTSCIGGSRFWWD